MPEVPVMVTVELPAAAVLLAVSIKVALANEAVTPLGIPEADSAGLPVKPFSGVTVMVLEPLAPCAIVRLLGDADRLKFGAGAVAFTVRLTVAVWLKAPEVPVMVTVEVPVAEVLLAVNVNVLPVNEAVTPLVRPEAEKATVPVKPFCGVTVMVLAPLAPCMIARLFGDADRVKFGAGAGAFTVRLTVVVWDKVPEVPVMVTVEVPVAAVLLAVSVNVLVVVALAGLKAAVTPLGRPEAVSATLPEKPFFGVTAIVLEPLAPCATVRLVGEADKP
jgi:hypothetical protein